MQRQEPLGDVGRALLQGELDNFCGFAQLTQIGIEIAQAQGGVNIFGVERGEDDVGHGGPARDNTAHFSGEMPARPASVHCATGVSVQTGALQRPVSGCRLLPGAV